MTIKKPSFAGSAAVYTLANILNGAIPLLVLPFLTHLLSPVQYGYVVMFTTCIAVFALFNGLGMNGFMGVIVVQRKQYTNQYFASCISIILVMTVCIQVFIYAFQASLELLTGLPLIWLNTALISSMFVSIVQIVLTILQMSNKPINYAFIQVSQTVFGYVLTFVLILGFGFGWEGRAISISSTSVFAGICISIFIYRGKHHIPFPDIKRIVDCLKFALPLLPHLLGGMFITQLDRLIIATLRGVEDAGLYVVGAQISMVIGIFCDSFVKAYGPNLYAKIADEGSGTRSRLLNELVCIWIFFVVVSTLFCIALPYIFKFLIDDRYSGAIETAQIMSIGFGFMGMYYSVAGFLFYFNKTATLSIITLVVGVFSVAMNYLLVSEFGIVISAIVFLIVQILYFVCAVVVANYLYPLPWSNFGKDLLGDSQ